MLRWMIGSLGFVYMLRGLLGAWLVDLRDPTDRTVLIGYGLLVFLISCLVVKRLTRRRSYLPALLLCLFLSLQAIVGAVLFANHGYEGPVFMLWVDIFCAVLSLVALVVVSKALVSDTYGAPVGCGVRED